MPTTMTGHTVASYDEELTRLAALIAEMGGMAEAAVADATRALLKLDHTLARYVIANDKTIDRIHRQMAGVHRHQPARVQSTADQREPGGGPGHDAGRSGERPHGQQLRVHDRGQQ